MQAGEDHYEMRGARQLLQWDIPARILSRYQPEDLDRVLNWHLRDFLLAYEEHLRAEAKEDYKFQLKIYASIAPWADKKLKPPKLPPILRGKR